MILKAREIVLGVTGAVSAYKALELARLLVKDEARVTPVMTGAATRFISPLSLAVLTGRAVFTDLFEAGENGYIEHIESARRADLVIVAPATANTIAKAATGIADNALTTLLAAARCPVLVAPSMNTGMWENPVVMANVEKLRSLGWLFVGPEEGPLACGEWGEGRLAEPAEIVEAAREALGKKDLTGEKVLVTAGPTREHIDPVRFVSNASSGRMGYALARTARMRGAEVVLVSGPTHLLPPRGVSVVRVSTASEMLDACLRHFPQSTIVVMAAAVADYTPAKPFSEKIKKGDGTLTVRMERTADILREIGRMKKNGQFLIGFALETGDLEENARRKLVEKNLDMVVANSPSGLDSETNDVLIITAADEKEFLADSEKESIAERIFDIAVEKRG